ncbi:MAG: transporter [Acidobacteria bacterium]|nr:MAG: transporter [Acidobacteriota bacterium]
MKVQHVRRDSWVVVAVVAAIFFMVPGESAAQFVGVQYGPRAFSNAPKGTNALDLKVDLMDMGIDLDGRLLQGLDNSSKALYLSYTNYFGLFGKTASVLFALPLVEIETELETSQGTFPGLSASGLTDPFLQFNIGLVGNESMGLEEFFATEPGFGMTLHTGVRLPFGEYDADSPLNPGANRFEFRFGFPMSYTWGTPTQQTSLELSPILYFFEDNDRPFGAARVSQNEALQIEAHLVHDFVPAFWGALNAMRVWGGATETDGIKGDNALRYASIGASLGGRLFKKLSYSFHYGFRFDSKDEADDGSLIRVGLTYTF